MKTTLKTLTLCVSLLAGSAAYADCDLGDTLKGKAEVSLLSNSYPILKYFSDQLKSCENDHFKAKTKLVSGSAVQEQARIVLSSRAGKSPYDLIQVSAASFSEFQVKGQLQPITDLVEKYREAYQLDDIPENIWKLATVDGDIYAVPIQLNMQEFFYRKDVLDEHGIAVPKTYDDVLAAAKILQEKGVKYPLSQAFKRGWNLATEFANIYLSLGGEYFDKDGKPLFNSEKGVKAAETLKAMLAYMTPNALSLSNDLVMVDFQQGKAIMGNIWATRAAEMDNKEVSKVVGKIQYAAAPTADAASKIPSTSIFWDGYVMPKNLKADRELVFKALMEMLKADNMKGGSELAFLARTSASSAEGEQYRYLTALREMVANGARPFPTEGYFNLAHNEIGAKLPDALMGKTDIKKALDEAAEAYYKEAKAQGYFE